MKLASICMRNAKRKHNKAGTGRKKPSFQAAETPIMTGTAAPVKVLGRAANIHACGEFVEI